MGRMKNIFNMLSIWNSKCNNVTMTISQHFFRKKSQMILLVIKSLVRCSFEDQFMLMTFCILLFDCYNKNMI